VALSAVSLISGELRLEYNAALTSLAGIENIDAFSINQVFLQNSGLLTGCAVPSICTYLDDNLGPATISNNGLGCSSRTEVENECTILSVDDLVLENIILFPNPATDRFSIADPNNVIEKTEIISSQGKIINVFDHDISNISVSEFPPGLYFIRIYDEAGLLLKTEKLVIR
jgi:hypothetical protein